MITKEKMLNHGTILFESSIRVRSFHNYIYTDNPNLIIPLELYADRNKFLFCK